MKERTIRAYRLLASLLICALFVCPLSACTRSAPRTESYQASESGQQTPPDSSEGTSEEETPPIQPDKTPQEVQAEFDTFTNDIFKEELSQDPLALHCYLRHPENYGIETTELTLGDFSVEQMKEASMEGRRTLDQLHSFETAKLTSDQLFTYRMLEDYLEIELSSDGLELYYQPLSPQIGIQAQLPILFAEYTFSNRTDVENYLSLLSQIDGYYQQLADYEKVRAEAGLAPSDSTLDRIIQSCKDYMIRPENSFLTETFDSKLEEVPELTPEEKQDYKAKHSIILKEHFIPAYQNLSVSMEALKGNGGNENGLCYLKDGKKYYEYLVASMTGTDSSIMALKRRIEKQIGNDMGQITLLLQMNPDLGTQVSSYTFSLTEPVEILESLREECSEDFPKLPDSTFTVKHVPKALESSLSPAFFLIPPLDSVDENVIYINDKSKEEGAQLYTTLAHEGYPGHLFQSLYFNQKNTCPLRRILSCGGYSEGWGTYAEIYSFSFNNGLGEELKKVLAYNQSAILALYSLLDIRIHYEGWDVNKTAAFLSDYYGITDMEVIKEIFQAIIDNPGNYLKYYTGYLEILNMRDTARSTLKDRYSPTAFHKFILDMEGASFRVIKPYFQTWLMTYDVKP